MNAPIIRRNGFHVRIPSAVRPGPDDSLELGGERKFLRLYQDGTLLVRVAADQDFLGWGVNERDFLRFPRLNPVAVAELHVTFVLLYRELVLRLKQGPASISVKLLLTDAVSNGWRLYMTEYASIHNMDPYVLDQYPLQQQPAEEELELPVEELVTTPTRAAYKVLKAFTSMFDLPDEKIPFSNANEVDIERIKSLIS